MNTVNTQNAKARTTAALCLLLALLTACTTAWFIVEGIQATEPASSARWAKVASGCLLLVLELSAFGLAGQWPEHRKTLRPLGWAILVLEITLMSVSQISIGLTAGKAASNGVGTIEEIRAQAKESRDAAASLRADADKLRTSKNRWLQQQAGERSAAAAEQSKGAAAAVAALERQSVVQVSTPIVEIVGKGGLIGLSIALSLALSLSGIVLMHVAGSLWRRAGGVVPVDQQILDLLHRIHGQPVIEHAPAPAASPAPAPASFKAAEPIEPKDYASGLAYSSKIKLAGAGLLGAAGALTAPITHAAPAIPAQAKAPPVPSVVPADGVSKPVHPDVSSKPIHAQDVQQGSADASNTAPTAQETGLTGVSESVHAGVSESVQQSVKKPRAKRAVNPRVDTGVEGKAGARFKRIKAGVLAGKIRPSVRGIQAVEGGSQEVVADYLKQLEAEGVIVKSGRGFALATLAKKGGAA